MIYDLIQGKKVLITGVSGQCGRGLAYVLGKKNEVHGVARFSKPEVKEELERNGCRTYAMDMGVERATSLPKDFDIVIHEAVSWGGGEQETLEQQNRSFHLSCMFVGDLMHRCAKAKFALVSTGSVYNAVPGTCKEDGTPIRCEETYTMSKIAMTQLARWLGAKFGRPFVVLRYWYPYTAYGRHPRLERFLEGRIFGDNPGLPHERTYVLNHINNTLKAIEFAKPEGEIFNSAQTDGTVLGDLARIGAKVMNIEPNIKGEARDPGPGHFADIEKLLRLIGPSPISVEEGFRRYLRGKLENINTPQDWMFEEEGK